MSGHNKWSSIKHKKGVADAKRGKLFSQLIKEITVAARIGGGDPEGNPRLRTAISAAKSANMPKDNIDRAIKKGTGELEGASYEEYFYEGYGPGGTAILIQVLTDNKNRAAADVRHILSKHGGNLGENGCVSWMFSQKGLITLNGEDVDEDEIIELTLEAGAEDVDTEGDEFEVITTPEDFESVKEAFDKHGTRYISAELAMVSQTTVDLDADTAPKVVRLMEALEDLEDVQKVWSNFDISDEVMERL
ncbi:MAG: YebC/PmpR family DNA-binding transcriptional regulator [Deltaproteobacteria bacterium]|nr:YebC/PmpR family DNA-binding transcriptional regulator [Deltaproteobacteria bacterium]